MEYDYEIEKIVKKIKEEKAKLVCLQVPDGMKPKATSIAKLLEEKSGSKIIIWAGPCWGACDTPVGLEYLNVDLLIQYGHSAWPFY